MFRIVTYNIRAGLGLDGIRSIRRIAEVLAPLNADVVCLQEVDQHVKRSWLENQPKFLGTRLAMHEVFQKNLDLQTGGYGNSILTKSLILHCRQHPLPGEGEPRGLLEVLVSLDGEEVTVFCTHLATAKESRILQAQRVMEIVRSVRTPHILCGDMNDVFGSQAVSTLLDDAVLRDSYPEAPHTYTPSDCIEEHARIDFVLADVRFDIKNTQVIASDASDHRPLVVDLEHVTAV